MNGETVTTYSNDIPALEWQPVPRLAVLGVTVFVAYLTWQHYRQPALGFDDLHQAPRQHRPHGRCQLRLALMGPRHPAVQNDSGAQGRNLTPPDHESDPD